MASCFLGLRLVASGWRLVGEVLFLDAFMFLKFELGSYSSASLSSPIGRAGRPMRGGADSVVGGLRSSFRMGAEARNRRASCPSCCYNDCFGSNVLIVGMGKAGVGSCGGSLMREYGDGRFVVRRNIGAVGRLLRVEGFVGDGSRVKM